MMATTAVVAAEAMLVAEANTDDVSKMGGWQWYWWFYPLSQLIFDDDAIDVCV